MGSRDAKLRASKFLNLQKNYYLRLVGDEQWCELGVNVFSNTNSMSCSPMGVLHMGMNDVTQLHVPQICQHCARARFSYMCYIGRTHREGAQV